jgi:hypothetical protein
MRGRECIIDICACSFTHCTSRSTRQATPGQLHSRTDERCRHPTYGNIAPALRVRSECARSRSSSCSPRPRTPVWSSHRPTTRRCSSSAARGPTTSPSRDTVGSPVCRPEGVLRAGAAGPSSRRPCPDLRVRGMRRSRLRRGDRARDGARRLLRLVGAQHRVVRQRDTDHMACPRRARFLLRQAEMPRNDRLSKVSAAPSRSAPRRRDQLASRALRSRPRRASFWYSELRGMPSRTAARCTFCCSAS